MIRPKLEYCSSICDPHHQKYIDKVEMVQQRAARFAMNAPRFQHNPPVSVTALINDLGCESLQTRRLHNRLTMMYKITNGLVEVPLRYHPVPRQQPSKRGHCLQFQCFQPAVDAFKYSFLPRTIPDWNALLHTKPFKPAQ